MMRIRPGIGAGKWVSFVNFPDEVGPALFKFLGYRRGIDLATGVFGRETACPTVALQIERAGGGRKPCKCQECDGSAGRWGPKEAA